MPYDNIIISEQPLFRTISERRQSRKAFVENPELFYSREG